MKHTRRLTAWLCAATVSLAAIPSFAVPTAAADEYLTRDPFFNFNSGYNYYTSEHFQFIWGNSGDAGQVTQSFLQANANNLETCWDIYVNKLGMTECAESVETYLRDGNKYKLNVYISGTGLSGMADDWAYMSWDRNGYPYLFCCVGAMRANPPSWVMPHEFGHAITAHQLGWNANKYSNTWWEALGNWFREQWLYEVSDQYGWTNDAYEGGYGTDFFETYLKNLCFTSPFGRDYYSSWVFLQYLTENPDNMDGYGATFVRTLLQKGNPDEYPFTMINRLAPADMKETLGNFAKRMATLDLAQQTAYRKRLDLLFSQGAWNWQQIYTMLEPVGTAANVYAVPTERAPQATGLNIVPLTLTGDTVTVTLNGKSDLRGADWRGCIVFEDANRKSYYSELIADGQTVSMQAPANTTAAYLTVIATPDEALYNPSGLHWHNDSDEFGETKQPFSSKNRYPYEVTIEGAGIMQRPLNGLRGSQHPNGGGFVASSARVDASVYVGPNAAVIGNATVTGNAVIDGYAMIAENATVSGNAYVGDCAMVMGRANVSGNAKILESACVYGNYVVKDDAVVKGVSFCMANGSASGQAILDGDYYSDGDNKATKGTCCGWYGTQTYLDARPYTDGLYAAYDFGSDSSAFAKERYNTTYALNEGAQWEAERTSAQGVMTFDGKGGAMRLDNSFARFSGDYEYQFAVLPRGGAKEQAIFSAGTPGQSFAVLTPENSAGKAEFRIERGGETVSVQADGALPLGEWSIIRIQSVSGTLSMEINGRRYETQAQLAPMQVLDESALSTGASVWLGNAPGGDHAFNGSVDFARVFFKAAAAPAETYSGREDVTVTEPTETTTTTTETTTTTATTVTEPAGRYLRGDVDCDGEVTLADGVRLAQASAGVEGKDLSVQGARNSDCNLNEIPGEPDDLLMLLMYLAGSVEW